jgi:hypothetical protein
MGATILRLGVGHADLHQLRRSANVGVHPRLIAASVTYTCRPVGDKRDVLCSLWPELVRQAPAEGLSVGASRSNGARARARCRLLGIEAEMSLAGSRRGSRSCQSLRQQGSKAFARHSCSRCAIRLASPAGLLSCVKASAAAAISCSRERRT